MTLSKQWWHPGKFQVGVPPQSLPSRGSCALGLVLGCLFSKSGMPDEAFLFIQFLWDLGRSYVNREELGSLGID